MSEANRFSFGFIPMIHLLILMDMVNIPWNMSRKSVLKTNTLFVWLGSCIEPVLYKTRCLGELVVVSTPFWEPHELLRLHPPKTYKMDPHKGKCRWEDLLVRTYLMFASENFWKSWVFSVCSRHISLSPDCQISKMFDCSLQPFKLITA